jgi:hypothetical protein
MKVNENIYTSGSTVRLQGEFFNFEGSPTDVYFLKVIIYDYKYNKLHEYPLSDSNRISAGKYFYDFITDITPGKYIYEFYGELDGLPALDRKSFMTKFIK